MTIQEITAYITGNFEGTQFVKSESGDFFFFYGEDNRFPFATIVTGDNEFDHASALNREGLYRLNIGIDKSTFSTLFDLASATKKLGGYLDSGIDFTAENKIMPHPMYGTMYWICVINPAAETFQELHLHLKTAYDISVAKQKKRES